MGEGMSLGQTIKHLAALGLYPAPSLGSLGVNLSATTLANYRAAMRAGTANVRVTIEGDSTMNSVDGANAANTAQYARSSIKEILATLLNARGVHAGGQTWKGVSGTSLLDYLGRNNRVTVSGGTVIGSNKCLGGTELRFPGVASNATFQVSGVDTMRPIWGDQGATGRTMSYKIDGGAAVNLVTSGVNQIARTAPVSLGAVGSHTISFDWVSGGTTLLYGVEFYDSTRYEITVEGDAISGGVSANFIDNGGSPGAGRVQQQQNFPPKLIFSELGIVNDQRTSVAVATSKANMATRVQNAQAIGADFVFIVPPYDGGTALATQQAYVDAMYQLKDQYSVGLIDMRAAMGGSYAASVANGYQAVGDNVHLTTAGKLLFAQRLCDVLIAAK
jgi:lysophospholipase L1-like esterase